MTKISSLTQIGGDIDGESGDDYSGHSVSFSSDGSRVAIGAYLNNGIGAYLTSVMSVFMIIMDLHVWSKLEQTLMGKQHMISVVIQFLCLLMEQE